MSQGELGIDVPRFPTPAEKLELAKKYGTTKRTLDRIVALAKEVGSVPDFFDARKLEEWVITYKGRQASPWLRKAAAKLPALETKDVPMSVAVDSVDFEGTEESQDMGLSTMRKVVQLASMEVSEAYKAGDVLKRESALRQLESAQKTLRLLEKAAVDLEKSGGDLVSKEKISTVLTRQVKRLGAVMQKEMESFFAEKFPDLEREEIRAQVGEVKDRAFSNFKVDLPA